MTRVFVFEYLTGGGVSDIGDAGDGALLAQGRAMRDAVVGDLLQARVDVTVAAGDVAPAPAGARACRALAREPTPALVARQAALHDLTWLVAPETGGLLALLRASVPDRRWIGCTAAAIALASSKRATLVRLAAHGIATPLDFADAATRWVVKPDDGAGAVATRVQAGRATAGAGTTAEPWVDGDAMSLSLLCRGDGTELLAVNRQHVGVDEGGRVAYGGVEIDCRPPGGAAGAELARLAQRVGRAIPGLRGFVGIDFVQHPRRGPVVIEVNPRLTCAYVGLSARLGRNLAAELVSERVHAAV